MKTINSKQRPSLIGKMLLFVAATLVGFGSCQKYDLDKKTPEWLGPSIYTYLSKNGYTTYVRLIEDLGYKEVLDKTGSKTLFVADEDAVKRFFAKGIFTKANGDPVERYEDLSYAQKKLILYGSMLNNSFQIAMLSSTEAVDENSRPVRGQAMRRVTSSSIYDSVPVISAAQMPDNNPYWAQMKSLNRKIVCLQDNTTRTMVFFTPKFLEMHQITDDDYDFLFNQGDYAPNDGADHPYHKDHPADATVNGVRVIKDNVKCLNGFVHVMEDVVYSLPNMAEYLANCAETKMYNSILDRYSVPYTDVRGNEDQTREIKRLVAAGELIIDSEADLDTVYTKRYFSKRSNATAPDNDGVIPRNKTHGNGELYEYRQSNPGGQLKFDPGWNSYYSPTTETDAKVAIQKDLSVMLVPNDDVFNEWWTNGVGKALQSLYQVLDSVPIGVIEKLVNNNMIASLASTVPSKFKSVLDLNNDPLGIETQYVDKVVMCCNGAIFFTNTVFSPADYRSVSFPALVSRNDSLSVAYWAIDKLGFNAYLNSMVSLYSFFIPSNTAFQHYVDPVSYGSQLPTYKVFNFYYVREEDDVRAHVQEINKNTGSVESEYDVKDGSTTGGVILNHLEDILDYHIVIGNVETEGYNYFQTKGRGTIKFNLVNKDADNYEAYVGGGYQIENNLYCSAEQGVEPGSINDSLIRITSDIRYDNIPKDKGGNGNGNGISYVINKVILPSQNGVYDILNNPIYSDKFSLFAKFMDECDLYTSSPNKYTAGNMYYPSCFNTYHYSIYVPDNIAMQSLIDNGTLTTADSRVELKEYFDGLATSNPELMKDTILGALGLKQEYADKKDILDKAKEAYAAEKTPANENAAKLAQKDFDLLEAKINSDTCVEYLRLQTANFIKYHIQDNSVYIGAQLDFGVNEDGTKASSADYETGSLNSKNQFQTLNVVQNGDNIQITDGKGNKRNVVKDVVNGYPTYNIMCRDYVLSGETTAKSGVSLPSCQTIYSSSYAVIHLIDGPLYPKE